MNLRKIAVVAAVSVMGFAGQTVAADYGSSIDLNADLKAGYEYMTGKHHKQSHGFAYRTKVGIEANSGMLAGLGIEGRLGGVDSKYKFSSGSGSHSVVFSDWGASAAWNFGGILADSINLRPMIGYENRYQNLRKGLHLGLEGSASFDEHELGLRTGVHFAKHTTGYDLAGFYNYNVRSGLALGLEVGCRHYNARKKKNIKRVKHYQFLGGLKFSA